MTEGPCLVVDWFDNSLPNKARRSVYYPSRLCSAVVAEDFMLGWMRRNGCTIRSLTWAWGAWPRAMPKGRLVPA
jgi:hypothetical protein